MPPIKHQQSGGSPEIISADIHIPDDADLGTGTFITKFKVGALPSAKVISSVMLNAPAFQVSVTINPNRDLPVLLGTADAEPKDRVIFLLPEHISPTTSHMITIEFSKWRIFVALFDGIPLATKDSLRTH